MPKYTEYELKRALDQAITTGNVRKAAKDWVVPRSTIQDRLSGRNTRKRAHWHRQRLSPSQEKHLADWVLAQVALGVAPTHSQLRDFAQRIVNLHGDTEPIGKNWIRGFLERNPTVKTVKGKSIDYQRLEGALTEKI